MKKFLSIMIALILFLTMIFPNLNNLLEESQNARNENKAVITELI